MVLGYLVIGWVGGAFAVVWHLGFAGGSILGAIGLFYATALILMIAFASLTAWRAARSDQRRRSQELTAPVPALRRPGGSDAPAAIRHGAV